VTREGAGVPARGGLAEQVEAWDGLAQILRLDRPTGAWIFIALHDDSLGAPTGGTRMRVYGTPAEGLADAQRLAAGMTAKWAAIEVARGGGKAVLALPHPLAGTALRGLLRRYGRLLASLRGSFETGPDLGIHAAELFEIAREAPGLCHGADPATGEIIDTGAYTGRGVFAAIRAGVRVAFGTEDLAGRTVLVQGLGSAGAPLVRLLSAAGARLKVSDLDRGLAREEARRVGAEVVDPERLIGERCDVYAPCAIGGLIHRESIPRLDCRVIAGSANNQLAEPEDGERLRERGILYAPDFIANAGGALGFSLRARDCPEEEIHAAIDRLGEILGGLFAEAARRGESPLAAARRRVEAVLARARAGRESPGRM